MRRQRALVIGGSMGGLFAAALLRSIGWEATVFERVVDDLASRGAGLGTHEELFAVLRRLGHTVDDSIGVSVDTRVCLDRSGRVTHVLRAPQTLSAWARIYRMLRDAVPAGSYRAGMTLEGVEQDAGGVTARFAGGARERGDLLIGADGVRSTVRALLAPQVEPRYAGYVAWRGLLDEWEVPPEIHAQVAGRYVFCLPQGEMLLSYFVPGRDDDTRPGRRAYSFVWYRPADAERVLPALCTDAAGRCHGTAIPPPLIRAEVIAGIRATARRLLAPQIAAVVERAPQPFFQVIFDLESPRMTFGRVVLLGDAAFVARPHVGLGVTKAALDAQCLADSIREARGDLDTALERYDRERRHFGSRIVARARWLGSCIEARSRPQARPDEPVLSPDPEIVMREIGSFSVDLRALTAAPA